MVVGPNSASDRHANLQISWLGHSCFAVEGGGYRIIIDPFDPRPGLPKLLEQSHMVLTSHEHADHNYVDAVEILPFQEPCPFQISTYPSYHDQEQGTQRGPNTIHQLDLQGLRVVHLGDLGHSLTSATIDAIGQIDALMVPVGGYYTIDAATAAALCRELEPQCIMPMHYKIDANQPISGLEEFLDAITGWEVVRAPAGPFAVTSQMARQLVVFPVP